jgi:pimeloyl-ACP methyl ester carboxylesterase
MKYSLALIAVIGGFACSPEGSPEAGRSATATDMPDAGTTEAVEEKPVASAGLTADEAAKAIEAAWQERKTALIEERAAEIEAKSVTVGDKTMRWLERTFGDAPEGKRSLWISMHGGGGAPARVNDSQWQNQIRLYELEEGIYIAPRAPTDTWNLWHEGHIDGLFDRIIESMIAVRGVDPNRVYLLGYSAGGDGVWQLAPRMPDRFAAAAMMAGHPNEAQLLGLRNLPFAILMGGADAAYDRNKIAADRAAQLAELHQNDPEGYTHFVRIYEGLPHWMNGKDAEALPWMAEFSRNPWPKKLVWHQDDVTHTSFYWLQIPDSEAKQGTTLTAVVSGQTIELSGDVPSSFTLNLSDDLLDLDQPVTVVAKSATVYSGVIPRSTEAITAALARRADPAITPTATLTIPVK